MLLSALGTAWTMYTVYAVPGMASLSWPVLLIGSHCVTLVLGLVLDDSSSFDLLSEVSEVVATCHLSVFEVVKLSIFNHFSCQTSFMDFANFI